MLDRESANSSPNTLQEPTGEPRFVVSPDDSPMNRRRLVTPGGCLLVVSFIAVRRLAESVANNELDLRALVTSCSESEANTRRARDAMVTAALAEGDERSAALARGLVSGDFEEFVALGERPDQSRAMSEAVDARWQALKGAVRFEDRACSRRTRIVPVVVEAP